MAFGAVRLALLAIATERESTESVVVAIGTKDGDLRAEWRIAIVDPEVFANYFDRAFFKDSSTAETLFDLPRSVAINAWLAKGDEHIGVGDGGTTDVVKRVAGRRLWIDSVTRVHFYPRDASFQANQDLPAPLAFFDTAGSIDDDVDASPIDARWVVSRPRLDAATDWPGGGAGTALPSILAGFRLVGHVPVAVNVHNYDNSRDAWAKRYDTRLVMFAHAARAQPSEALWSTARSMEPPPDV